MSGFPWPEDSEESAAPQAWLQSSLAEGMGAEEPQSCTSVESGSKQVSTKLVAAAPSAIQQPLPPVAPLFPRCLTAKLSVAGPVGLLWCNSLRSASWPWRASTTCGSAGGNQPATKSHRGDRMHMDWTGRINLQDDSVRMWMDYKSYTSAQFRTCSSRYFMWRKTCDRKSILAF